MPQHEPATADELEDRYQQIEDLIAQGFQTAHILKHAREKTSWGVSDRQVRNYIDIVRKRLSAGAGKIDRRFYVTKTVRQLEYIADFNIREGNHKIALMAINLQIKLQRLDDPAYEPNWKEVAEKAGTSPEKLVQMYAEMFDQKLDNDNLLN